MKAIVLDVIGGRLGLQEVEPPAPGESQVLIRVHASGVNFADSQIRTGQYPFLPPTPVIPGNEVAGIVAGIGNGVDGGLAGKRVVATLSGTGGFGGYAEYAIAPVESIAVIPDAVSDDQALAVLMQGLTAYFLLTEPARLSPGNSVLIHAAAGGVGSIAIQLAKLMGVEKVFAAVGNPRKLAVARSLGADVVLNYTEDEWTDEVLKATDGRGVDVILASSTESISRQSLEVLAPQGRFVVYGSIDVKTASLSPEQILQLVFKNQSLTGFYIGGFISMPESFRKAIDYLLYLVAKGALQVISTPYLLEDAQLAHEAMAERKTIGKVFLKTKYYEN